jgi:hypothetical protein
MKPALLIQLTVVMAVISITSCSYDGLSGKAESLADRSPSSDGNSNGNGAGIITAGEWNDLDNWDFWKGLLAEQQQDQDQDQEQQTEEVYSRHLDYWGLSTSCRIPVTIIDRHDNPICGAKVELYRDNEEAPIWTAISDNKGSAELWDEFYAGAHPDIAHCYAISVNGAKAADQVAPNTECIIKAQATSTADKIVDIAFIVDATGSMRDEIQFLKDDLIDILNKVKALQSDKKFRTGTLFYRDEGDEYLTKHDNFSEDPSVTLNFIKKQEAHGGGDFPEAVHTALERTIQNLSWTEGGYARLAFLILDAPPHHNQEVLSSVHRCIKQFAAQGIKIIPVSASGIDRSTEALLRLMAIFTDGTYVFITNDSGVGNSHITPSVGEYQVESLNSLIVRLINKYSE